MGWVVAIRDGSIDMATNGTSGSAFALIRST